MAGSTSTRIGNERSDKKTVVIRCIYMLLALYERPRTVAELLDYFAERELEIVDKRTVQRDLVALDGHFGLYRDEQRSQQSRADVWALDTIDFERLLEMDDAVALALVLAEQQLQTLGPMQVFKPVQPLFDRARHQLQHRDTVASRWLQRVKVTSSSHRLGGPHISSEVREQLQQAALEQAVVRLHYHRHQGDAAEVFSATVLGMFFRAAVAYVIIRQNHDQRLRQLPFSRISKVEFLLTEAPQVLDFDLDRYAQSGALAFRYGEPFRLTAVIFNSVRREIEDAPLGEQQQLSEIPGQPYNRLLEVTVPYTLNLIQWLMARAPYLKIIGPEDFRERFRAELQRGLDNFEQAQLQVPSQRTFGG